MTTRFFVRTAAAFACAALLSVAAASAADHRVLVLNAAESPIFAVRIGHAEENAWGPDLLPFNDVVDVSRGRELRLPPDLTDCSYDVSATFGDGTSVVLRDVDLCTVTELRIRP